MKSAARLVALALVLTAAAFQLQQPNALLAADPWVSNSVFREFFPAEDGLRWSGAASELVIPGLPAGLPVRISSVVSGWRPPGVASPRVTLSAGGQSTSATLGPGASTLTLDTVTPGWWDGDLRVVIQSETFSPSGSDRRRLGTRFEEVHVTPLRSGLRMPPLRALSGTAFATLLAFFLLRRTGVSQRPAERVGALLACLAGISFASAPSIAGVYLWPLVLFLTFLLAVAAMMRRVTGFVVAVLTASARAMIIGLRRLADVAVAGLVVLGLLLVVLAYRAQSRIDIDFGSGREVAVAHGFGSFEGKGGARSRGAPRGAQLDLSDFGGGATWKVTAVAAYDGAPREVAVLRAGDREIVSSVEENRWTESAVSTRAPFGWTSGLLLTVPGGSDLLRIDRVTIERTGALPSIRIVAAVIVTGLLALVAFGTVGLSMTSGRVACAFLLLGSSSALALDPLATIPFIFRFLAIVAMASILAALLKGLISAAGDGTRALPGSVAMGAAVSGWVAWLSATAFPYYRGGHFVFHSSIAEEIWKGRFLIYYLPYPGSMLSEQAQWGHIVMPHPALWQTLVSPLSALPRPWFYLGEKVVLASLFASLVLLVSVVAERVSGRRAAAFASVIFVGLVPGFQMLGLGHLMTILGVWSSSLALSWLMFRADQLDRRSVFVATVALFTFCFLSYTAALLFTGAVLVFVILVSLRSNFPKARLVFTMLCAASLAAFLLYYVNWTLPFVLQSVPRILGGAGLGSASAEATPVWSRLALEPGKLTYSYGSMLIPLVGVLGLFLNPRSWPRLILLSWAGILFFVSGLDLFFNFLLKHHYYVMLPVAVGLGLVAARMEARFGRAPAIALTLAILFFGARTAFEVALGLIP